MDKTNDEGLGVLLVLLDGSIKSTPQ